MNPSDTTKPDDPRQEAMSALADFEQETAERLEDQSEKEAKAEKRKTLKLALQGLVIVVCLGIVGYQVPRLNEVVNAEKQPLRRGTMATNAVTDQCISNLWIASKRLQAQQPVGNDLFCPASNQPFEVRRVAGDVVVRSPRPDLYGFKEIRVSKLKPVPELIQ
jgi:hypothetical protein